MSYSHPSAMPAEAVGYLECQPGKIYVYGTMGGAGHARMICERILPDGRLIGIDQDTAARHPRVFDAFGQQLRS